MRLSHPGRGLCAVILCFGPLAATGRAAPETPDPAFRAAVETDWALQEARARREIGSRASVDAALARARRLIDDLSRMPSPPDLAAARRRLTALEARAAAAEDAAELADLYRDIRWLARGAALSNPLLGRAPLVFLTRRRFISQMLHEYMGYYYDYGDIAGGGVHVLVRPGHSFETRDLVRGRLGRGNYTTLAVSFDARTVYFAFAPRAERTPDYYSPARRCFDIYALDVATESLRRLTDGPDDDFDPCPLPDGGIAFMSTRRGGFGRCHNPWEPLPAYTLHRMQPDGSHAVTLSHHETNEWHPSVLHDGRIVYSRWDYVDRSAAHFHGLWASHPDGANPVALFGNYTQRINACFQPRAVPGSRRIVFVAGAHHAVVGGAIVLFDPARAALDPAHGEDDLRAIEVLTPEVCFPEAPGWPSSYFHSPWPLAENYHITAFSFDPLPGMGPRVTDDHATGIYLLDRFGNMELLYREPGISSMYPVPLAPRPAPPVLPSARTETDASEGEFFLTDVNHGIFPLPSDRPVRALRVFQILPKSETHVANVPRLGYANAESARMLLGTVPVEADGSAYFRAPAGKPIYFQAVDARGRAIQTMRSVTYLQGGESRGCAGCHEPRAAAPAVKVPAALKRPPSTIAPGPDGSQPWSFPRLVGPILALRCAGCHDGGASSPGPALTPASAGDFTVAYRSLQPYVRWYEWGEGIGGFVSRPGRMPADESPLTRIIDDETHAGATGLTDAERRALYLWMDGNAAFYGTYSDAERLAQRRDEAVPPPRLQ